MTKTKLNLGLIVVWFGSIVVGLLALFKGVGIYVHYYHILFAVIFVTVVMFIYWRSVSIAKGLIQPSGLNSQRNDSWKRLARIGIIIPVCIFVFCWFL